MYTLQADLRVGVSVSKNYICIALTVLVLSDCVIVEFDAQKY